MPRAGRKFAFRAYRGLEGLERLAAEWIVLLETIPDPRFNQFPEWYRAYLSSLVADDNRVWFVAAYRGGALVAICPMQFQDYRVGVFRPRILGTIEDGQMQLSDFVFAATAENQALLHELTQWLRVENFAPWDELRLRKVSEESSLFRAARARLPKGTVPLRHDGSAFFHTASTYQRATQAVTAKFRSNLRRRNRIAEQSAPLSHRTYRWGSELGEAFEVFLEIEASGWKGAAASAIRCRPALLSFYQALLREFTARDACIISLLWHGDQPVAGQFCLRIGRTLNILKVGFSEAHANFAPGILLLERMIRQSCDDPGIDVLHLVNEPEWSRSFRPLSTGVWSYCAPNWTARGIFIHMCLLAKRTWEDRGHEVSEGETAQSAGVQQDDHGRARKRSYDTVSGIPTPRTNSDESRIRDAVDSADRIES